MKKQSHKLPSFQRPCFELMTRNHRIPLGNHTLVMGIVNITPDSFSQDGCLKGRGDFTQRAVRLAKIHYRNGASFIDFGGESTRPGSLPVSEKEELRRIIPAVQILSKILSIPISVDTYKKNVARHALDAGASMINLIRGVRPDKSLLKMISSYQAAIVLMHMMGTPRSMQRNPTYTDCVGEIIRELKNSLEICLENGIKSDRIIIDPGIGFGKTLENNLEILNRLREFSCLGRPVLIGTSRKSFIGKILKSAAEHRLMGSVATVVVGIMNGAHIVRVHDVKAVKQAVDMTDAILQHSMIS